jgi:hypothetical protein
MNSQKQINSHPLNKGLSKDKEFKQQLKIVFEAFYSRPATMLMISKETGIYRANICRYVAKYRKQGAIFLIKKGLCPISKHPASFLTTNPELFTPIVEQLKFF